MLRHIKISQCVQVVMLYKLAHHRGVLSFLFGYIVQLDSMVFLVPMGGIVNKITGIFSGRRVFGMSYGKWKVDKETWWWNDEVQEDIQTKEVS